MGNQDPLLAWWLGLTLSQLLMLGMSLPDAQASPQPRHDDVPLRSYFSSAGPIIGGAAWGALALVGPYDASPQSQAILCVVLCSVTLAGTGFSRSVSSYSAFAATVLLPLFILLVASPPARVPGAAFWLLAFAAFALIVRSLHTGREGPPQDSLAAFETTLMPHQAMVDNARAAIVLSRGNRVELCNRRFAEMMRVDESGIAGSRLLDGFESRADWHHHARAADTAIRRGSTYHASTHSGAATAACSGPRSPARRSTWRATRPRWSGWPFDVTERMMDSAPARSCSPAQLRTLIARSTDWYWKTDPQHRLMHVTHEAERTNDTSPTWPQVVAAPPPGRQRAPRSIRRARGLRRLQRLSRPAG
jgi:PAS domain-containing protein